MYTHTLLLVVVLQLQPYLRYVEAKCTPSRKPFAILLDNCTLPGTTVDSWGISSIEIGGTNVCLTIDVRRQHPFNGHISLPGRPPR
jgi:hypothetical protein